MRRFDRIGPLAWRPRSRGPSHSHHVASTLEVHADGHIDRPVGALGVTQPFPGDRYRGVVGVSSVGLRDAGHAVVAVESGEVRGEAVELPVAECGKVSGEYDGVGLSAGGEAVDAEPVDGMGRPVGGAVVAEADAVGEVVEADRERVGVFVGETVEEPEEDVGRGSDDGEVCRFSRRRGE